MSQPRSDSASASATPASTWSFKFAAIAYVFGVFGALSVVTLWGSGQAAVDDSTKLQTFSAHHRRSIGKITRTPAAARDNPENFIIDNHSNSAIPGSAAFPYTPEHRGLQHDARCSHAGCDLQVPQPPSSPVSWDPADLPLFPGICLDPAPHFNNRKAFSDDKGYAPIWEPSYPPIYTLPMALVSECRDLCIKVKRCVSWTHDARNSTPVCVLRPAFAAEPTAQLELNKSEKKKQAACTTGVVRAGIARHVGDASKASIAVSLGGTNTDGVKGLAVPAMGNCGRRNCMSVPHCAAGWTPTHGNKFAFVLTDDLQRQPPPTSRRPRTMHLPDNTTKRLIQAAKAHGVDLVYLVPPDAAAKYPLTPVEFAYFETSYEKLKRGKWLIPPNMVSKIQHGCTMMEMIRFGVMGLEEYDAVIYLDSDVHVFGDMTDVFKCVASTDRMLYTNGPRSVFNMGFYAVRPDKRLVEAFEYYMARANYTRADHETGKRTQWWGAGGWDGIGFAPNIHDYITSECGQGIMPALYFKNGERNSTQLVDEAWLHVGRDRPTAYPLDRCQYNWIHEGTAYSRYTQCEKEFTCGQTKLMHKMNTEAKTGEPGRGTGCFYYTQGLKLYSGVG
eukprot:m.185375 g.185375  ORF g.185375 m.185375 type:complete len:615 (+) comp24725_c0_seq1:140-1984(+)